MFLQMTRGDYFETQKLIRRTGNEREKHRKMKNPDAARKGHRKPLPKLEIIDDPHMDDAEIDDIITLSITESDFGELTKIFQCIKNTRARARAHAAKTRCSTNNSTIKSMPKIRIIDSDEYSE